MDLQQQHQHYQHHFASVSSIASTTSPPITPTFSAKSQSQNHTRWPSSSSSLATTSDSPSLAASKTTLHDLVEDPSERDDVSALDLHAVTTEEPLCICDTAFCEHRRISAATTSPIEWLPGDDFFADGPIVGEPLQKRRRSGDVSVHSLTHRLSRRLPSLSKRWHGHKAPASPADVTIRSAPLSRASSFKHPMPKPSSTTARESLGAFSTAASSRRTSMDAEDHRRISSRRASQGMRTTQPLEIAIPPPDVDSDERPEPVSTPLLPPMMDKQFNVSADELQSPLQEPTVASRQMTDSWVLTPPSSVFRHPGDVLTPPLSTKNSTASLRHGVAASEIPPLSLAHHQPHRQYHHTYNHSYHQEDDPDPYSAALGHANFTIHPAPYFPATSGPITAAICQRLLADWEAARKQYLHRAADISRDYGPTSTTFHHAEAKWRALDLQWRRHHTRAIALLTSSSTGGDNHPLPHSVLQSLAAPSQKSLHAAAEAVCAPEALHHALAKAQAEADAAAADEGAPPPAAKFPCVAREEMVGSMVQYAKLRSGEAGAGSGMVGEAGNGNGNGNGHHKKKPGLLRLFTDPRSFLFPAAGR